MRLFVYGLLGLHLEDDEFNYLGLRRVEDGTIQGSVYDGGMYPMYKQSPPGSVVGVICDVENDQSLKDLDRIEGLHLDPPLYDRVTVRATGKSGRKYEVFAYEYHRSTEGYQRVEDGNWLEIRYGIACGAKDEDSVPVREVGRGGRRAEAG